MGVCIRADFPHDSWWTQATLVLSDGTSQLLPLEKTDALQLIDIGRHSIRWVRIENWVKYDEPAQFPALIAWKVYGRGWPGLIQYNAAIAEVTQSLRLRHQLSVSAVRTARWEGRA